MFVHYHRISTGDMRMMNFRINGIDTQVMRGESCLIWLICQTNGDVDDIITMNSRMIDVFRGNSYTVMRKCNSEAFEFRVLNALEIPCVFLLLAYGFSVEQYG